MFQNRTGLDYSDDPDGDNESDAGIFDQIAFYFILHLGTFVPIFAYHRLLKTFFVYIVSGEEQEERDRNQTTVAVILVIAWCLVAIIAFFYYKKNKTGINNDILAQE